MMKTYQLKSIIPVFDDVKVKDCEKKLLLPTGFFKYVTYVYNGNIFKNIGVSNCSNGYYVFNDSANQNIINNICAEQISYTRLYDLLSNNYMTDVNPLLYTKKDNIESYIKDLEANKKRHYFLPVKEQGYTIYVSPKRNTPSVKCNVFLDLFDFLAYQYLVYQRKVKNDSNCIIMHDETNFVGALMHLYYYESYDVFLPQTIQGRTILLTLMSLRHKINNMAIKYEEYTNLFECVNKDHSLDFITDIFNKQ